MLILSGKPLFYCAFRDITEIRRAEERIKEEMSVTNHLLMIAEATIHTTDIDKLMEQIVHCGHEVIRCDICLSYLWDEESKVFQPCQEFGLSRDMIPVFRTEPVDENIEFVRKAVEGREPVVENPPRSPFYKEGDKMFPPLSKGGEGGFLKDISTLSAAIPLIGKTGTLGLIVGIYSHPVELTERDKKIMMGISQQVSVALEQARLYKESVNKTLELSHKIETIRVMNQIDRSILSTLKADELLETVTRLISKVIPCDRATVSLVDMERGGIIYKAGFGTEAVQKGIFVSFADTSAKGVVERGRTECVNNLPEMAPLLPLEKRFLDEGFLSQIRVPITIKGDVAGILTVGAKRVAAFTKENL
ncbi:MAG: GAF domain-containing protein, partial [Deltaproteobacteria bacterium]